MSDELPKVRKVKGKRSPQGSESVEDKEQYSLDEMMKRLRDQDRGKEDQGEVVTRPDGSLARKVKRRRRRSEQPESAKKKGKGSDLKVTSPEAKRRRTIFKIVAGVSIFLITLLAALYTILHFNSKSYREASEAKVGEWIGADVNFDGVKLYPSSISMTKAEFAWPKESYLAELTLNQLSGNTTITGFIGGRMGGYELGGRKGKLAMQMARGEGSVGQSFEEEDFPFQFNRYFCNSLDVSFGDESRLSLYDVSTSFRFMGGEGYRVTLDQGSLRLKQWEELQIANAAITMKDGEVELTNLSLEPGIPRRGVQKEEGTLKLSGPLLLDPGEKSILQIESENFPFHLLIGKNLAQFFRGRLYEANGSLAYHAGHPGPDEIEVKFAGERVSLSGFPFIATLHELFPTNGFDELSFERQYAGTFRARTNGTALEGFNFEQRDMLRLMGDLIVSNEGEVFGEFTLSMSRGLINPHPLLSNLPIFQVADGSTSGFSLVKFKVGGTVKRPTDQFRQALGLSGTIPSGLGKKPSSDEDPWEKLLAPLNE